MLYLKYINPTGMFSFGHSGNIQLGEQGLVYLMGINEDKGGDSNGAGKSSLFNAVCEILFGENPTGVKGAPVANQLMQEGFAGRIEFVGPDSITYRVTYCRSWKSELYAVDNDTQAAYKGTGLFLDVLEDEVWKDRRGATIKETRALILDVLPFTYSRFIAIAYMSHRVGSRLLRGTNKERLDIISGITGVEEWDEILQRAREHKNGITKSIGGLQAQVVYEEGARDQLLEQIKIQEAAGWDAQVAQLETEGVAVASSVASARDAVKVQRAHLDGLNADQEAAFNASGAGQLSQDIADLRVLEQDLRNPTAVVEGLPQFDPKFDQDSQDSYGEVNAAQGMLHALTQGLDLRTLEKCPTCEGKITETKKKAINSKVNKATKALSKTKAAYAAVLAVREEHHKDIEAQRQAVYAARKVEADEVHIQWEAKNLELAQSKLEYEQVTASIHEASQLLQTLMSTLAEHEHACTLLEQRKANAVSQVAELSRQRGVVVSKEQAIEVVRSQIREESKDEDLLNWLIGNIPYIKLHRLSVTMTALTEQVNRYLLDMGESIRVNISSFEEKKSSKDAGDIKDRLKSEVKIEVIDGVKNIDPRLYSDGETSKISNALIRALHVLALQNGHGCNVVLMDEIFSFVDSNNSQKLAESFTEPPAGTVLVTDNSGFVSDLMNFSATWVARKNKGRTLLEVG